MNSLPDLLTELPTLDDSKKFRLQGQKYLLTYKTHLDKESTTDFFNEVNKKKAVKKIYIAHENGEGDKITPYEHTHIVLDFGSAIDKTNPRIFDIEGIHPHISKILNVTSWRKACSYITKEDKTVILDETDKTTQMEAIWGCDTIQEALRNCELKDAMATIAVYKHKPRRIINPELSEDTLYPWQTSLQESLMKPPNNRTVVWIYDEKGNTGKTQFAKYMCLTFPAKCIMMNNIGRITDFANNIKNKEAEGWNGNTVFLNLSRSYSDRSQIYDALEMIADGYITCTKYTGGDVWMDNMHVIVLANFYPETRALSADRWKILRITRDMELAVCNIKETAFTMKREG